MTRAVSDRFFQSVVDSATAAKLSEHVPYRARVNDEWCYFCADSFISRPDQQYEVHAFRYDPPWPVSER